MKRSFCIFLICVLLISSALPAGAVKADFIDEADVVHTGAVAVLSDLGLISGYSDGYFRPDEPITREQIAKLIALLCTDDVQSAHGCSFTDVSENSWALPYIGYCAERGIIVGSDGLFRPKDNVTAQELAKMLLAVLGYDPARYTGAQWAANVSEDAAACNLYRDISSSGRKAIRRDDACQMILNALQNPAVVGFDGQQAIYALDELMNPLSYIELRYGAQRYTGMLCANEEGDLLDGGRLREGKTRLLGHKLFDVSSDASLLGQMTAIYVKDDTVIGLPCAVPEQTCERFDRLEDLEKLMQITDYSVSEDAMYFMNRSQTSADLLQRLPASCLITVYDHDGDLRYDVVMVTT